MCCNDKCVCPSKSEFWDVFLCLFEHGSLGFLPWVHLCCPGLVHQRNFRFQGEVSFPRAAIVWSHDKAIHQPVSLLAPGLLYLGSRPLWALAVLYGAPLPFCLRCSSSLVRPFLVERPLFWGRVQANVFYCAGLMTWFPVMWRGRRENVTSHGVFVGWW